MQKMLASLFSLLLSFVMCEVGDGQSSSLYKPRISTIKFSCLRSIIHVSAIVFVFAIQPWPNIVGKWMSSSGAIYHSQAPGTMPSKLLT